MAPNRESLPGTRPEGASNEREAARQIREMFSRIAPRYDFLNHVLSLEMDRVWRRRATQRFGTILSRENARVLDLCCGTGDLLLALARGGRAKVFGSDFAHPMLVRAVEKWERLRREPGGYQREGFLTEADALALPFGDGTFDLVTAAFGFRNLANYESGLREMLRVLRPGGEAGIVEFSEPRGGVFGPLFQFYFRSILPRLGRTISGDGSAYSYLPNSVARFPSPEELAKRMQEAGFSDVRFERWTGGAVTLHRGRRAAPKTVS
jgi:demethylmenaquinone methyltransferase/2-methoxy-6-polyprenyl-1,4-benzoquinol methylase